MKLALILITTLSFALATPTRSSSAVSAPGLAPNTESATAPQDERGLVALDQALREIANPFTVLCVAARPGDEDDGALAYLRKKLGARTVTLFATRGEGEDSWTRPELNEELGAAHTREALDAARVTGSDVFFLNLRDIGYSKAADEPLSIWGHDEALRRMTRAIRLLRPDVIITNHDAAGGEGVQQAVARLLREAFAAAAVKNSDTKVAPGAGSEPWQARRLFSQAERANSDVTINFNEYDRVRGLTYAELGLAAHHRFASRAATLDRLTPERETSYYKLIASSSDETMSAGEGLLDGLTLGENVSRSIAPPRVGGARLIDSLASEQLVDVLIEKLIEKRAEGTAETMHERYGAEFVRVLRFTASIERALILALGVHLEVALSDRVVVPGQKLAVRATLRNGGPRAFPAAFTAPERLPVPEKNPTYNEPEATGVATGAVVSQVFEYEIAKDALVTLPQSAHLYDQEFYAVGSSLPGAQPAEPFGEHLVVSAEVGLGQVSIRLSALARFDVARSVEISTMSFALIKDWSTPRDITIPVRVRNRTPGPLAGALWLVPLALTDDEYEPVHVAFSREDEELTIKLKLRLPIQKPPLAPDVLIEFRREKPAPPGALGSSTIAVKASDLQVSDGLKVGCIRGVSDWLLLALNELGVDPVELKATDITITEHGNASSNTGSRLGCGDLSRFDTIILDENSYLIHPELIIQNRCLFRYVRQGGNLIVLAQRPNDWNLVMRNIQFAPYPLKLSTDRIAFEESAVKIIDADNAAMLRPNKITTKDFEGWVIDRAIAIPKEWSTEYTPLLETSDPGEDSNRGTLLVARYGEGAYIYTSLAWRRQLLIGNGGAYRVFANLVSPSKSVKTVKPQ